MFTECVPSLPYPFKWHEGKASVRGVVFPPVNVDSDAATCREPAGRLVFDLLRNVECWKGELREHSTAGRGGLAPSGVARAACTGLRPGPPVQNAFWAPSVFTDSISRCVLSPGPCQGAGSLPDANRRTPWLSTPGRGCRAAARSAQSPDGGDRPSVAGADLGSGDAVGPRAPSLP